jgi:ATP-dependent helicase HrpB
VIESEGRRFPVDVRYSPVRPAEALEDAVARGLREELDARRGGADSGDVLVFLPGVGEIRRAARRVAPLAREAGFELAELYGELAAAAQDRLFERGARSRIVLATNVAETSITLPAIDAVVDSGLARVLRHDPATGIDRLVLGRVSRASADQRAGRAGRERAGRAWRLWSEPEHRALAEREVPEVLARDLSGALLALVAFGEGDARAFPWFEAPAEAAAADSRSRRSARASRDCRSLRDSRDS